jgi:hypothetical protein
MSIKMASFHILANVSKFSNFAPVEDLNALMDLFISLLSSPEDISNETIADICKALSFIPLQKIPNKKSLMFVLVKLAFHKSSEVRMELYKLLGSFKYSVEMKETFEYFISIFLLSLGEQDVVWYYCFLL